MIVDRDGVMGDDEFYIGVFSRDDLAHPFGPDRAVKHSNKRRALMHAWAEYCEPKKPAKVVSITERKRRT